jgi:multidrug transporter EmrE-like cation transporter
MNTFLLLAIGGSLLTIGDIIFKFWVERSLPYVSFIYIGGFLVYMAGLIFLIESFKAENIAIASAIFILINIATLALVSWFYFDEKLSVLQIWGLALAIISIALMQLGRAL